MLCRKCRRRHAPPSGHWAVGSDPTFFTDPIFPTRFPTELLTTRWEMAPWNGQQLVKKAIFSGTKRHCKIQDNMGGNGLGNLCSIPRLSSRRPIRCLRFVDVAHWPRHWSQVAERAAKALSANSTRCNELGGPIQ